MKKRMLIINLLAIFILVCCTPVTATIPPINQPTLQLTAIPTTKDPILPTQVPSTQDVVLIKPYQDVRSQNVPALNANINLGEPLIETLWFNQATLWSDQDQPIAQNILKLGMNPGMGVRDLHAEGITGKGVNVAIIDQPLALDHPEYQGKIIKYIDVGTNFLNEGLGLMHGPAVTSLLVGENIGTAPGAKVYFFAAPSWFLDAQYYADALDWIIAENEKLPAEGKIRVISVSAAPSGIWSPFTKNNDAYNQAYQRATDAGILVLDATFEHGMTSRCKYDLNDPDNVAKCIPEYLGPFDCPNKRIYIPTSRRSMATGGSKETNFSYQYTGQGGDSWSVPYLAGVLAMGWQVNPDLTNSQLLDMLYASAYVNNDKKLIIDPKAFIDQVRLTISK